MSLYDGGFTQLERESTQAFSQADQGYSRSESKSVEKGAAITKRATEESRDIHGIGTSGALSSGHLPPIWQVPLSLIESAARRYEKGNTKYPIHNWRGGLSDPAFLRDRANHAATHLMRLLNGDDTVDDAQGNVDAISWFCAMINEALRLQPQAIKQAFYSENRGELMVGAQCSST